MTQKEIEKFLANTKVYVNGKSKEIQEKLFSFGYKWNNGNTKVDHIEAPFLFIYTNMYFTKGSGMEHFGSHKNREITADEILSLELTEPSYRPFKNREECWNEMLKHQPFGWIKAIESGDYYEIGGVCEYTDFQNFAKRHKFADGTPFGIKED